MRVYQYINTSIHQYRKAVGMFRRTWHIDLEGIPAAEAAAAAELAAADAEAPAPQNDTPLVNSFGTHMGCISPKPKISTTENGPQTRTKSDMISAKNVVDCT